MRVDVFNLFRIILGWVAPPQPSDLIGPHTGLSVHCQRSALGKLPRIPMEQLEEQIVLARFTPLPIQIAHTLAVHTLPKIHKDPFDRLLVAQAKLENLTLVTRDLRLKEYGLPVLET